MAGRDRRRRRRSGGAASGRAREPRSAAGATEREFSCGGVVLRGDDCLVIRPVRPDARSVLALPKGHPEEGEDPPTAALREIREETSVVARVVGRLGEVVYWYQRDGRQIRKTVRIYLCEHQSGEPRGDGHETLEASWLPLARAARELSFPGDRRMAAAALERTASSD